LSDCDGRRASLLRKTVPGAWSGSQASGVTGVVEQGMYTKGKPRNLGYPVISTWEGERARAFGTGEIGTTEGTGRNDWES